MKAAILTLVLTFLFLQTFAQCEQLVWEENFNGSSLNLQDWEYLYGDGCPNLCGWGNAELQHYTDSPNNVQVQNGVLKITARRTIGANPEYTSGRIRTKGTATFQSGRIEARIKMPIGQGLWPAFWMLPEDYEYGSWPLSGEIDITEVLGQETNISHGTIHYGAKWPMNQYQGNSINLGGTALHDNFHTYSIEWEQDIIRWYLDGQLFSVKTANDLGSFPWRFDQDFHILLNVAIGGNWPGYPNAGTPFPQSMEVDYIRVYEQPQRAIMSGPKSVFKGQEVRYEVSDLANSTFTWSVDNGTIVNQNASSCTVIFNQSGTHNVHVNVSNGNCSSDHSYSVIVGDDCGVTITNFENRFGAHWTFFTGGYNDIQTPAPNAVNNSPSCANWNLAGNSDDRITLSTNLIQDANVFSNQDLVLAMKVRSNAPQGTPLEIKLQNENIAGTAINNGVHSSYVGITGPSNVWTWVYFTFNSMVNPSLNTSINQMMIRPLSTPGFAYTIAFDDISILSGTCTPAPNLLNATLDLCGESANNVRITGPWWNWDPNGGPIANNNGDGTWSVNFNPAPSENMEYLWVVDGVQENLIQEMINGATCAPITDFANYANRLWQADSGNIEDFFDQCSSCGISACTNPNASNYNPEATNDNGSCLFPVHFSVDMNQYQNPFGTVYISGIFNNWSSDANPLTDENNDGIWETTIDMSLGNQEYKFQLDQWSVAENLNGSEPCTITFDQFVNRLLIVSELMNDAGLVCWNSCASCPTTSVTLTFQVDLANETPDPSGVYIMGDFQGWNPSSTPMNHVGYGLYTYSIQLNAGSNILFTYLNGNELIDQETVSGACTALNEFGEIVRSLQVPQQDQILPLSCFGLCDACSGCNDPMFSNFNPYATSDDGSCSTGLIFGCTYQGALNFLPQANQEDGSCLFNNVSVCPTDLNNDGLTNAADLLTFLGAFGEMCQ